MNTHTPGPWDWMAVGANASGGHHLYVIDANGRKIAALWGKADEKAANASLIVAAPDLYELLKRYRDAYPAFRIKPIGAPGSEKRVEQERLMALEDAANAAIAKAEGRP